MIYLTSWEITESCNFRMTQQYSPQIIFCSSALWIIGCLSFFKILVKTILLNNSFHQGLGLLSNLFSEQIDQFTQYPLLVFVIVLSEASFNSLCANSMFLERSRELPTQIGLKPVMRSRLSLLCSLISNKGTTAYQVPFSAKQPLGEK